MVVSLVAYPPLYKVKEGVAVYLLTMPPLAASGPALIAVVIVIALLLTWVLLRMEMRDEAADEEAEAGRK
jgi:hypothetical protein